MKQQLFKTFRHLTTAILSLVRLAIGPALFLFAMVLAIVALGYAQRTGWIETVAVESTSTSASDLAGSYICPMMCTPPSNQAGRCPVCAMELVKATSSGPSDGRSIVIDAQSRRVAGIQTVAAKSQNIQREIVAVGKLAYDEGGLRTLSAYVAGRIDRLHKDFTGVKVARGELVAEIYSPDLYAAQVEFLSSNRIIGSSSLQAVREANQSLLESTQQRLVELGLSEKQVAEIRSSGKAKTRLELFSPIDGTVIQKSATEGDYVKEGQVIYRLADLSHVWLMLEVLPADASMLRFGQRVSAEVKSLPNTNFEGRIAFVSPEVDDQSQTVSVRVVLPNPAGRLRVGDFATGKVSLSAQAESSGDEPIYDPELAGKWISPRHPFVISDKPGVCTECGADLVPTSKFGYAAEQVGDESVVTVPRSAILRAGKESIVYKEVESGRFEPQRVTLGAVCNDEVIVLEGISEGDLVATAGNFLIDSQMQLSGNPSLIDPEKIPAANMADDLPMPGIGEIELPSIGGTFETEESANLSPDLSPESIPEIGEIELIETP